MSNKPFVYITDLTSTLTLLETIVSRGRSTVEGRGRTHLVTSSTTLKKSAWPYTFSAFRIAIIAELLLLARVDFLKRFNWFVSSRENNQNALVKYHDYICKHVDVVIQPYFQIYYTLTSKFTVLCYSNCPITHRTANMQIRPFQIMIMLG